MNNGGTILDKDYLERVMRETEMSGAAIARAAGVAPSTINRILNDPTVKHSLSRRTMLKIEQATGIPIPADYSVRPANTHGWIRDRLKLLAHKGKSQSGLARHMGWAPPRVVEMIKRGRKVGAAELVRLAEYLELDQSHVMSIFAGLPVKDGPAAQVQAAQKAIGERLREAREARGYKDAADFARVIGINLVTYRAHESGRGVRNHVDTYADALRVRREWFRHGTGERDMPTITTGNGSSGLSCPGGAAPGGDKDDNSLHPFIQGLMKTLPQPETAWAIKDQVKWLQTAASIFGLIYKADDGTIRVIEKNSEFR